MRCKGCDAVLTDHEMYIREETGEFEDLCLVCRKASQCDEDDVESEIEDALLDLHMERKQWED